MAIRKTRLPSQYQQVEYIESSGTQYIDTQVISSTQIRTHIKFEYTQFNSNYNRLFGTSGIAGSQYGCRSSTSSGGNLYGELPNGSSITTTSPSITLSTNTLYDLDFNTIINTTHQLIINGNSYSLGIISQTTGSQNIWLFGQNPRNTELSRLKLYYCQIYDNGTLVRNFIPCYRKTDNVIGLYDTVNGVFYTNAGSGDFTKGNDVVPQVKHIYKGSTKVIKSYKGTNLIFADVPSTFQRVEYIESSGTQYIDTGFVPSNTSGAKIKFYKTNTTDLMYFGVREQTSTNSRWSIGTTTYLYCGFNDITYFELNGSRPTLNNNETFNVEFNYKNNRKLKLNGDVGDNDLTNITLTSITKNAYIFAANWGGTPNYFQSCRIYNVIFTDNSTIVRYFIPCYRKADNEIGLYDVINGVFYTNAGTGTFTKGANI